jgi:hypothetical protein
MPAPALDPRGFRVDLRSTPTECGKGIGEVEEMR